MIPVPTTVGCHHVPPPLVNCCLLMLFFAPLVKMVEKRTSNNGDVILVKDLARPLFPMGICQTKMFLEALESRILGCLPT